MMSMTTMRGGVAGALLGAALVLGGPAEVRAQQADTVVVTLDEAVAMARRANPAFRRATNALDQNGAEFRNTLMGQVLPNAQVSLLNTGYRGNLSYVATDPFGDPIARPDANWSYFSSTNQSLRLSWTIQGKSVLNALKSHELTVDAREAGVETAGWTLVSDLRTQYYDVLERLALLGVEEDLAEGRRIDFESAQRRFGIAQASRVDVLNAEVQIEQQEIAIRNARSAYEQALLTLRTTIGDPEARPFRVAEVDLPIFDPNGLEAESLIGQALRSNPQLRETEVAVDEARLGVDRAGESWWPNVSLDYTLGRASQAPEFAGFADLSHEETDLQSSFQVFVSFPILNNWFQDRAEETQARVTLANQQETRKEQRLQVESTVRTELINLRDQYESLQLAERSAEIAAESSELARAEYRIGTRTFEQLQQTLQQEADARRSVIQARFGFVDALLTLERAVGSPIAPGAN